MPVTREQAERLVAHALDCRPTGAPRWDGAGVLAAIGRVRHLAYPEVAMAVTRAASDRDARTPGVIAAVDSIHWREKVTPPGTRQPAKAGKDCPTHPGEWAETCRACAANRLAGEAPVPREEPSTRTSEHAAKARRLLRGDAETPAPMPEPEPLVYGTPEHARDHHERFPHRVGMGPDTRRRSAAADAGRRLEAERTSRRSTA